MRKQSQDNAEIAPWCDVCWLHVWKKCCNTEKKDNTRVHNCCCQGLMLRAEQQLDTATFKLCCCNVQCSAPNILQLHTTFSSKLSSLHFLRKKSEMDHHWYAFSIACLKGVIITCHSSGYRNVILISAKINRDIVYAWKRTVGASLQFLLAASNVAYYWVLASARCSSALLRPSITSISRLSCTLPTTRTHT